MEKIVRLMGKTVIGMVHCPALPGTPSYDGDFKKIIDRAVEDAVTLEKAGANALIVENMGDVPFTAELNKSQIVALTASACAVRNAVSIPIGVDAAFNDVEVSLNIALACGGSFIRVPVYTDTVLYSDGIIYPAARKCADVKAALGLHDIQILADVQVKHTFMLNPQITVEMSAAEAASNGADALIVTGAVIGAEAPIDMIRRVKEKVKIPVLAGSGVNAGNIHEQLEIADGCIIGSSLKKDGIISNPVDYDLVRKVIESI